MSQDLRRRLAVTVCALLCALATAYGVGALGGTPVSEAAGGALAADATLIAPGTQAFGIWSVIYVGLAGYVIWQWLPPGSGVRGRAIGWWAAASLLLNGAWLVTIQLGWLWASVPVILALAIVLKIVLARLHAHPRTSWIELAVVDGTFGLYLGWVAVATCANIAAALAAGDMAATGTRAEIISIGVLLAVLVLAIIYARRFGGRFAVAGAMAWGVAWIAVARLADEPGSVAVGVSAAFVAALILALPFGLRPRRRTEPAQGPAPATA
ncbi:tryptophan-rich sensory protein [Ruania suaedae]|uniref:tryptophan-rich sensory protein n=1 Tax=Ruania suaedae TaxID=2897774 RepID=UPI001E3C7C49|nr:tryptophan-rich sensory protein [Ruania suaedae]UFU03051.1 tryptophan-rich sensory protein [Ruania suaedae]